MPPLVRPRGVLTMISGAVVGGDSDVASAHAAGLSAKRARWQRNARAQARRNRLTGHRCRVNAASSSFNTIR